MRIKRACHELINLLPMGLVGQFYAYVPVNTCGVNTCGVCMWCEYMWCVNIRQYMWCLTQTYQDIRRKKSSSRNSSTVSAKKKTDAICGGAARTTDKASPSFFCLPTNYSCVVNNSRR